MPITGDIYQLRVYFYHTIASQSGINTVHLKIIAHTAAGITEGEMATALGTKIPTPAKAMIATDVIYRGLTVQKIWPLPLGGIVTNTTGQAVGGTAGNSLPLQVSAVITTRTGQGGRRFRGRIFVPFVPTLSLEANTTPTAGAITSYGAYALALLGEDTLVGSGGTATTLGVLKQGRWGPGDPPINPAPAPNLWPIIVATFTNDRFGTQRRRGSYGRINKIPL